MDESKYKSLKSKHDLLKDAFKKLYGDYETLKGDLSLKIEEYAKLHEENAHLKHAYDLLSNETSLQNQKASKASPSWANPLTLIKGSAQQGEADNSQKLNEEISQLKSKLESSLRENELLQEQNVQNLRDLEDTKAKHSVVVTELKDRLIALESILKDLQDQSNKNETKLAQYSAEIKSLNAEIEHKSSEINTLNRTLEGLKRDHEKESDEWKLKLNEKFKFDLCRNHFINVNNIYQNSTDLDHLSDVLSNYELFKLLVSSLSNVLKAWRQALSFSQSSLINSAEDSADSTADPNDPTVLTFALVLTEDATLSRNMDLLVKKIDDLVLKICENLDSMSEKMEAAVFDSVQYNNISHLFKNLKEFFKLQRVYFCVEEYLVPATTGSAPKDLNKRSTSQLISLLRTLSKIIVRLHFNLRSILYLVTDKRKNLSSFMLVILNKECGRTSDGPEGLESEIYESYMTEIATINTALDRNSKITFLLAKQFTAAVNGLKEALSHRLCYPKVAGGNFLPFSGGTNQMVNLTSSLSSLGNDLLHLTESRVKSSLNYLFTSVKYYRDVERPSVSFNPENFNSLGEATSDVQLAQWNGSQGKGSLGFLDHKGGWKQDKDERFGEYSVRRHGTLSYLATCNEQLVASQPRIKLVNLEQDLQQARKNEGELTALRSRCSDLQESLAIATQRADEFESELHRLKSTDKIESICQNIFSSLQSKLSRSISSDTTSTYIPEGYSVDFKTSDEGLSDLSYPGVVDYTQVDYDSKLNGASLHELGDWLGKPLELRIRKMTTHLKHLIRTITSLEDSNKQLKFALELNRKQCELARENEDSVHKNYSEQLVRMSEHISELNNAILASEYKIAELTQTKVSCPSCGFNNTLGSMMGVDDKGRCSSCRCIVIFSSH